MDGLVLRLRDEDRDRFQGELESTIEALAPSLRGNIQYESLPGEMIGGMVLLNDKQTIRFDLTLQTLLEDRRGAIGEMLHETFDKAGMSNE
jgi:vacuolar-type H+-ATPase subunit E/Vma4